MTCRSLHCIQPSRDFACDLRCLVIKGDVLEAPTMWQTMEWEGGVGYRPSAARRINTVVGSARIVLVSPEPWIEDRMSPPMKNLIPLGQSHSPVLIRQGRSTIRASMAEIAGPANAISAGLLSSIRQLQEQVNAQRFCVQTAIRHHLRFVGLALTLHLFHIQSFQNVLGEPYPIASFINIQQGGVLFSRADISGQMSWSRYLDRHLINGRLRGFTSCI